LTIAGIDPEVSGAVAFLTASSHVEVVDVPTSVLARGKRSVDAHALAALFDRALGHVFLEPASARPGQGMVSMFGYGESFGLLRGVLAALGIPRTLVAPATWKGILQVPEARDGAKARASQLLPASAHLWLLKHRHGRAESALVALYGLRQLAGAVAPSLQVVA